MSKGIFTILLQYKLLKNMDALNKKNVKNIINAKICHFQDTSTHRTHFNSWCR